MVAKLQFISYTDFTGGLVTNKPSTELEPNQGICDNIIILPKGFKKRLGDTVFNSTAMNSGANVQGIEYYNGFLVAVCGAKLYKSDSLDGTMDEITYAGTITAGQNNLWTFCELNGNVLGFGGAPDAPFQWTGSGDATVLAGSPPTADFCFSMKDRVFAGIASTSTLYWSILSNSANWTGTGSGNQVVITSDDDTLIGGIPLNNDVALLFKNYSIHRLIVDTSPFPLKPIFQGIGCCGKKAMVNVNGVVYFITKTPRMKATNGYQIIDFPDSIDDLWDGLSKSRLAYIQGLHDPVNNLIHWICSDGVSSTNNLDLIWDLGNKCWLRNTTGWDCNCISLVQGYRIFGGHTNGKIYEKYKASTYRDNSEASPYSYNGYWRSGWLDIESKYMGKQVKYIDVACKTQTSGDVKYAYGYNYNQDSTTGSYDQISNGGQWDLDFWDSTFTWGGEGYIQKRIFFFGSGNNFQIKLFNNELDEPMEVNNYTLAIKPGGSTDINR